MHWNEFRSHIRHLSNADQERLKKAFEMGKDAHSGQKRASGEPYFTHPIAVAYKLADMDADADTLIAALLHDTVEDTDLTLKEIDDAFNGEVANLIDGLTKFHAGDFGDKPTMDEKIETLRKIFTLMDQDVRIMVIKLADRLHNMQTIEFFKPEKQQRYARETMDIFVKIADRLSMLDMRDELEALCLAVLESDTFRKMSKLREKNELLTQKTIKKMNQSITESNVNFPIHLVYEYKKWDKLRIQLEHAGKPITGVSNVTIAVICDSIEGCYSAMGILHQLWSREHLSFQDYINAPMINGYRGLHTTIILDNGDRVRCKIRTKDMHSYARKGVTSICFDSEAMGLQDYIPWTKRIHELSAGTTEQSKEFWRNLQSDILGESIVVHGMDDQAIMLPEGSTVLDGAFYCYDDEALMMTGIKVNGNEVPPSAPLENGVSLEIDADSKSTVKIEWLQWVQTGLAAAKIRAALATKPRKKKLSAGKDILQSHLSLEERGFIEEFQPQAVQEAMQRIGYHSTEDAYIAMAEGRIAAAEVAAALFSGRNDEDDGSRKKKRYLEYTYNPSNPAIVSKHNAVYEHFRKQFLDHHLKQLSEECVEVKTKALLSSTEMEQLEKELRDAGATNIVSHTHKNHLKHWTGIVATICLWAFDPVFAYKIIHAFEATPVDMTLMRFWVLTLVSMIVLGWRQIRLQVPQKLLPLNRFSLWAAVVCMVGTAICTYVALVSTLPTNYSIPMTIAGFTVSTALLKQAKSVLFVTWACIIGGISMLIVSGYWATEGIIATALAVAFFTAFVILSEQYKRKGNIGARSDQYFFVMFALSALFTLPLVTLSTITSLPGYVLLIMILFTIIFNGLPYYLYYFSLSLKQYDFIMHNSFLILVVTMLGQAIFIGLPAWHVLAAGTLVTAGAVYYTSRSYER